jgi:hypothetical protein
VADGGVERDRARGDGRETDDAVELIETGSGVAGNAAGAAMDFSSVDP